MIIYIHQNPLDLGIELKDYKFSSYQAIISSLETVIKKEEVLEYFDTVENFIFCHKNMVNLDGF